MLFTTYKHIIFTGLDTGDTDYPLHIYYAKRAAGRIVNRSLKKGEDEDNEYDTNQF